MKKLALILGVAGCFSVASADMTRTFEGMVMDETCDATDYGPCMLFEYGTKSIAFAPASTGFGTGNVLKVDFTLDGAWASAGVGIVFNQSWEPQVATSMTALKISLRTDKERDVELSLKTNDILDPDYDAFSKQGISYMATKSVDDAGASFIIPITGFIFPTWWKDKPDADGDAKTMAQAWVGSKVAADMVTKRTAILEKLVSIQVGIPCREGLASARTCDADKGWVEVDNVTLVGVKDAEGADWWDEEPAAVQSRHSAIQALRATIDGSMLKVVKPEASSASLELVRLDGSKVASWTVSGTKAAVALPAGLEKGAYFAVLTTAGHKTTASVSVVR